MAVRQRDRWTCVLEHDRKGGGGAVDDFVRGLVATSVPMTSLMAAFEVISMPETTHVTVGVICCGGPW